MCWLILFGTKFRVVIVKLCNRQHREQNGCGKYENFNTEPVNDRLLEDRSTDQQRESSCNEECLVINKHS